MIKTNPITPVLAHLKEGNTITRASFKLEGARLITFRALQIASFIFGWGIMLWLIYLVIN